MADHLSQDELDCPPPSSDNLDFEDTLHEAMMEDSADFNEQFRSQRGPWVKPSDGRDIDYDLVDMEDPRVPLWMLTDWVMNVPLEDSIGTEPLLLNPGLNVSAQLAALIAARCKNALPARGVLRGTRTRDPGRSRHRVRWRDPVVTGEQDPPGYELASEDYDAQTIPWFGSSSSVSITSKSEKTSSYGHDGQVSSLPDSQSGGSSWWKSESSEASSNREAWSRSWATGSHVSWDSWTPSWTNSWEELGTTSNWRRSQESQDPQHSHGHQWWQSQLPWHRTSSWSDNSWSAPPGNAEVTSETSTQRWSAHPGNCVPLWKLSREVENGAHAGLGNLPKSRGNRSPDRRAFFEAQRTGIEHTGRFGTNPGWSRDLRPEERTQVTLGGWWADSWGRRAAPLVRGSIRRPKEGWKHPEGMALTGLEEGLEVCGTVTNITKLGAFINIGAQKDGLLGAKAIEMLGRSIQVGDVITELVIGHIDLEKNRISLRLANSAKGGNQGTALSRKLGESNDREAYDVSGLDRRSSYSGTKNSRNPSGGPRGEPTTADWQDLQEVAASWKHPMWTEGGTGGTRGARE